jgi:trans-aconitate methyltransferase
MINRSIIDPYYAAGEFYSGSGLGRDSKYKVKQVLQLLTRQEFPLSECRTVADVGCGPGETTRLLYDFFPTRNAADATVIGFDVHPKMKEMKSSGNLRFVHGDFCQSETVFDLAILLDVIEHVPAPVEFMRLVASRARRVVLHIPLDDSVLTWLRNHARI